MVRRWWSASWRSVLGRPFFGLLGLYFLLRLPFLKSLPIFNDEAIYLDWAWRQLHEPGSLFFSLNHDGKPPLLLWLFGLTRLIIPNPLAAARLVSVCVGSLTVWGIYRLGRSLGSRSVAWVSGLIYAVAPLLALYDRQALMESALGAVGVWSFYLFCRWRQTGKRSWVRWAGVVLGIGLWLKTTGLVFGAGVVGLAGWWWLRTKNKRITALKGLGESGLMAFGVTIPLWAQAGFWAGLERNSRYVLTFTELLRFPIPQWAHNLRALTEISFWQLTPGVTMLALLGLLWMVRHSQAGRIRLIAWLGFQMAVFVLISRQPSPRYLVSFLPGVTILAGFGFVELFKRNWVTRIFAGGAVVGALGLSLVQMANPRQYFDLLENISAFSQKEGYVTGWPAGFGVPEAWQYLEEQVQSGPILVGVRLDSGNPESAILALARGHSRIHAGYLDVQVLPDLNQIDCLKAAAPLYFVSRDAHLGGLDRFLEEERRFYKPEEYHWVGVYRIKKDCQGKTLKL
jgi:4-amino-4-deoxy-L-arabinose transferase-like glycosyltransferase